MKLYEAKTLASDKELGFTDADPYEKYFWLKDLSDTSRLRRNMVFNKINRLYQDGTLKLHTQSSSPPPRGYTPIVVSTPEGFGPEPTMKAWMIDAKANDPKFVERVKALFQKHTDLCKKHSQIVSSIAAVQKGLVSWEKKRAQTK